MTPPTVAQAVANNGNRFSVPELEQQIADLKAQVESLRPRPSGPSMYVCTRCGALYTSIWGCGCIAATRKTTPSPLLAAAVAAAEALSVLIDSLAAQDDEGLIEHAPQMENARTALAALRAAIGKENEHG